VIDDGAIARLSEQVGVIEANGVREAYLRFALSLSDLIDARLVPSGHGYIERELRFYVSDNWYFAAVLSKNWVLFYFRWPALRDGFVDAAQICARFSEAETTPAKDVKLRVTDLRSATRVCNFLAEAHGKRRVDNTA
jgi:predicted Zn-dependent protease